MLKCFYTNCDTLTNKKDELLLYIFIEALIIQVITTKNCGKQLLTWLAYIKITCC